MALQKCFSFNEILISLPQSNQFRRIAINQNFRWARNCVVLACHGTMSEFLREAIRLYMDEREWLRQERRERATARRSDQE